MAVSPTGPEWFILQTADLDVRQMSRTLADNATWFAACFGTRATRPPKPLREHMGLSVYPVNIPTHVLDAMLELLHFPMRIADAYDHVPVLAQKRNPLKLGAWRAYLIEYGFVSAEHMDEADAIDDEAPPKKKPRRSEALVQALRERRAESMTPREKKIARVARAFYAFIMHGKHPRVDAFMAGDRNHLLLDLCVRHGPMPEHPAAFSHATFQLESTEEAVLEPSDPRDVGALFIDPHDGTDQDVFRREFGACFVFKVSLTWVVTMARNASSTQMLRFFNWPLASVSAMDANQMVGVTLSESDHSVVEIRIKY